MMKNIYMICLAAVAFLAACTVNDGRPQAASSCEYASYFDILADSAVVAKIGRASCRERV